MSIYLVRHCSATGQEPDAPLTDEGREQSLRLSSFLAQRAIVRIVSSPFKRAVDSAGPLSEKLGLPIEIDERLAERQLGLVENGDWLSALNLSFRVPNLCLPGGESSLVAQSRGVAVIEDVFREAQLPTAVFSHGNLLALIANSVDESLSFDFWRGLSNPDLFEVTHSSTLPVLSRVWPGPN
jgi:2,3-bisphosphoglycerate-dependent phosphoglycerate mutase